MSSLSFVATLLHLLIALPLCAHVLLSKEQESVAVGWIAVILLSPFVGIVLYLMFGINRIERKARALRSLRVSRRAALTKASGKGDARILRLSSSINDLPFLQGNSVEPLINGDAAYPAMLDAIQGAKTSVAMSTYIFDHDPAGLLFVDALTAAARRGVAVRVLIDDFGAHYSDHPIDRSLRAGGVTTARFLPRAASLHFLRVFNLRNHRKILHVDGTAGFIGGMNVRQGHVLRPPPPHPVQDIHFRVRGPVLDQMGALFEEDWEFSTGANVELPRWMEAAAPAGPINARLVPDGPDHRADTLQWLFLGALAVSQKRVRIMTPYFVPNTALVTALSVAAMRGVEIEVVVPERLNVPLVGWAMAANFERLMSNGVKIYLSPPPFDHSKVMVVDGRWALVGSTNWDQRSLRLNFEANLECLDQGFGADLEGYIDAKKAKSRLLDLDAVRAAPLWIQLRNNATRLLGPYL